MDLVNSRTGTVLRALLVLLAIAALLAILELLPPPRDTHFWNKLYDGGHAPLFGCMALLILALQRIFNFPRGNSPRKQYLIAFILPSLVGIVTELLQIPGPRDADPMDALADMIGACTLLALFATIDGRLPKLIHERLRSRRWTIRFVACALFLFPFTDAIDFGIATIVRDRQFPLLCGFENRWESKFVELRQAKYRTIEAPTEFVLAQGKVGEITFDTSSNQYPALGIEQPFRDWRNYDSLMIDYYLPELVTRIIYLRVHDITHNSRPSDRFNRAFTILGGGGTISVPIRDIENGPRNRKIDLSEIRSVRLFTDRPDHPFIIYFDNIRLK